MNRDLLELRMGRRRQTPLGHESAEEIIDRTASAVAKAERAFGAGSVTELKHKRDFQRLMVENKFWPAGRILNNAGTRQGQVISCLVLPFEDNFDQILETLAVAARCHQGGAGTGFDLSPLRERGAPISLAEAGGASGPVSWMQLIDAQTAVVSSGGKMRGANLASLSVYHPDIEEFIESKATVGDLANLNISVAVDDDFMRAVQHGDNIDLVSPLGAKHVGTVAAQSIFERIALAAWATGDPGVLFIDRINASNSLSGSLGPILTTNPCGEQTLYPYEPSSLGSINLSQFHIADGDNVNWADMADAIRAGVRLLDNSIEIGQYPDSRVEKQAYANRRLGLGVMGFADLLAKKGLAYDSEATLAFTNRLARFFADVAHDASSELAEERGSYPNHPLSTDPRVMRNCAVTSIAPTGTISMIAECSSGIEPRFAQVSRKDVMTEEGIFLTDPVLIANVMDHLGVAREEASVLVRAHPIDALQLPRHLKSGFRYAHDIAGEWHVRVAATWQRWIDNAVSKTVNLPVDASPAEVEHVFELGWELGCKGISVYRAGSRDRDLLANATSKYRGPTPQSRALIEAGNV